MRLPGDGFSWRKLTRRQLAIGLALFAIIISGVTVTAFVIRPAGAASSLTKQPPKEHDDPRAAGKYFQQRHYGTKLPAPDASAKAQAQAKALPQFPTKRVSGGKIKATAGPTSAAWTPVGPAPEDYSTCTNPSFCTGPYGHNTGRITALAVDPTDSTNLWVGTADGGLWHSTDGGANYTAVSDGWQTLAIGSIAIDPNDHNTVYVGTGEGNFSGEGYWGVGIYKTTDGGTNWTQLGFNKFGGMSIGDLAVDPNNSNNILA
ncbi:MAG TPA: hypothetical protein VGP82_11995, partial [Ktedonobacterales bacterium]|nr:hypothetical protein [Ktedonobacterales bacterium]